VLLQTNVVVLASATVVQARYHSDSFVKVLTEVASSSERIYWQHLALPSDALAKLAQFQTIRLVSYKVAFPSVEISEEAWRDFTRFAHLESLDFTDAKFASATAALALFNLANLTKLKLKNITFTKTTPANNTSDAYRLASLTKLRYLSIDSFPRFDQIPEALVSSCCALPNLTHLNIRYLHLSERAVNSLRDCSTTLTRLSMRCKGISEIVFSNAFRSVSNITSLRRLSFRINRNGEYYREIQCLSQLVNLEHLDLTGFNPPEARWMSIVKALPCLQFLRVHALDAAVPRQALVAAQRQDVALDIDE